MASRGEGGGQEGTGPPAGSGQESGLHPDGTAELWRVLKKG